MLSRLDSAVVDAPADQLADPLVGRSLDGRYLLERTIARGGMATVYLATDTRLDRTVAVKVMHRALADDPEFVARFTREARSAARLSAPEVVAVFDQGTDAVGEGATGMAFLVMEHVQGRTVRDLLRERGALSPARAVAVVEPVLRALAAAHAAGIVHRDVKPENVLLADDGRVKVADFGLARAVESSGLTATTGVLLGTVAYLSPEQVEKGVSDERSDVYSAGVLLWELLTGTPPYSGESPLSVAYRHVHDDVPAPSTVVSGVPASLDALVVRATRRDPAARPVDGGAFLAELRAVATELPDVEPVSLVQEHATLAIPRPDAPQTPLPATPRPRRRRRRGRVVALVVVLLSLLAAGGGWWLGSGRYTEAPSVLTLTFAAAEAQLTGEGFSVRRLPDAFSDTVAAGQVVDQDPDPGARVRRDGTVGLVVSKGPDLRAVPAQVVGSTLAAATALLTRAGLTVGATTEAFDAKVDKGLVLSSDPKPGQKLRPGTTVKLVISKGVELLAVPDVQGRSEAEATQSLRAVGFRVSVTQVFDDEAPKGQVVDQSPSRGTAPRGSTVALEVSKGPDLVAVPELRGMTRQGAQAALKAAGLKGRAFDIPNGSGTVVGQDPAPGTMVRRGSTVTYYVS